MDLRDLYEDANDASLEELFAKLGGSSERKFGEKLADAALGEQALVRELYFDANITVPLFSARLEGNELVWEGDQQEVNPAAPEQWYRVSNRRRSGYEIYDLDNRVVSATASTREIAEEKLRDLRAEFPGVRFTVRSRSNVNPRQRRHLPSIQRLQQWMDRVERAAEKMGVLVDLAHAERAWEEGVTEDAYIRYLHTGEQLDLRPLVDLRHPDDPNRNPHPPNAGRWPASEIQSLLFSVDDFTVAQAKAWAKEHGYRYGNVDTTENYHRLRQFDPTGAPCRTMELPGTDPIVKAVVCRASK